MNSSLVCFFASSCQVYLFPVARQPFIYTTKKKQLYPFLIYPVYAVCSLF